MITMANAVFFLSLVCLASSFITFGLGIAAYIKNPRSAVNRLFFIAMLAAAWWAFGEFMIWQAGSAEGVWFWLRASSVWPFAIAFTLHFTLAFTSPPVYTRYKQVCLFFLYIPATFIAAILLVTDWIYTVEPLAGGGFAYITVGSSPAYQFEAVYFLCAMLAGVGIIFSYWQKAATTKVKKQAMLICAGIATVIFFGFLSGILLPFLGIYGPNLVFIGIVIFSFIITLAISRHELFVLSPRTAIPDILETMPDAMILADLNGAIISTNRAAGTVFSCDSTALPGKTVTSCLPEEDSRVIMSTVLRIGTIADYETVTGGRDTRTVSIAGSVVKDPSGEPAGIVLIARDITDRKAAEHALMIAGKKISLLTQVTRHDINNLVSALAGYLLLLRENPDDPSRHTYIAASMEIAERISAHLQFTREYQEIGSSRPAWLDLAGALDHALEELPCENITTRFDLAPVEIFADPMFVKVLYNLLENAVRHGGKITRIHVSAIPRDDRSLLVTIEDDGIGIAPDDKENIFRYGFGKNTGLGLAVSRDILSLTGITISETGVAGSGARFEMVVPHSAWRLVAR